MNSRANNLLGSLLILVFAVPVQTMVAQAAKMERCVGAVLQHLAKANAPASEVGPAVLAQCDAALKARLAAEIAKGAAGICTVESCIGMARARTAEEARVAYQAKRAERQ